MKTLIYTIILFLVATVLVVDKTYAQGSVPDQQEFLALKMMWDSLGGSGWTTKTNWPTAGNWPSSATSAQMATWYGVTVSGGDVTAITMRTNLMAGKIPTTIGQLSNLTSIDLRYNSLTAIPSAIGNLTNLQTLELASNQLAGVLPSSLNNLTKLITLDVSSNKLTGTLPNLGNLTLLNRHLCDDSGSTPSLPAPCRRGSASSPA